MTFGAGGHTRQLLESVPDLKVFGLDRDPHTQTYAQKLADETNGRFIPLLGRFSEIKSLLKKHNVTQGERTNFPINHWTELHIVHFVMIGSRWSSLRSWMFVYAIR